MLSKKALLEKQAQFWELIRQGSTNTAACEAVGVDRRQGLRWRTAVGGNIPRRPAAASGRYLSLDERLRIADLAITGVSLSDIAVELGRSKSTICRELARNGSAGRKYAPYGAQKKAEWRARRPKPTKLASCVELRDFVVAKLEERWSPEQISASLIEAFPGREEMRVSHETIYQSIFVQGRGELRRELHRCLRSGRAVRRPKGLSRKARPPKIVEMIMISERPAEADDRAVPGHWEGDLILGSNCRSAIGTLVERASRFTMLVHLPGDHSAETVRDELVKAITTLPEALRRSLAWDQGTELARHKEITFATGIDIFFCDPHSPWQRGSNENTNGLLRQYFPKGTDLSVHAPERLAEVAAELNSRPRKTLGWATPAQSLDKMLLARSAA
ncbi:MAG: IS30 family transposase [Acidimicrobiales bacterium]